LTIESGATESGATSFSDADLSPFCVDADRNANQAQRRYTRKLQLQLALLIVAAIAGAFTLRLGHHGADYAGLVGALAFIAAIFVRLFEERVHDDREWYESRAAAESAKTLSWRYAVGGNPFPESMADAEAKRLLVTRVNEISHELTYIKMTMTQAPGGEVTPPMTSLRQAPRPDRIRAYQKARLKRQTAWYSGRSAEKELRSRQWLAVVITAEALGLIGAVVKASGATGFDLLGIFAAASAGIGAWVQSRQYRTLATAYNLTARELRQVSTLVDEQMSADDWANFVDQAEEAISREHTMWIASRTGR
jgi:hypothetical protein